MKRFLALLLPIVISACATPPPPRVEITNIATSQAVTLEDLHPVDENKLEVFSYLVTSERYGVFRLATVNMEPSALRLLQHRAYERLKERGPLVVKVHHFVVYQNLQGSLRAGAFGSVLGPLGAVIATASVNNDLGGSGSVIDPALFASTAGDNEWKRGITSPQENPNNGASLVTWLDGEVNGKRVFVRVVSPVKVPEGKVPYVLSLESTYDFFLKQF